MAITGINGTSSPNEIKGTDAKQQITRDDFLKLLISQLQNQDPLKPLDNQEFASQLATFNSLEQLIGVNERLETLQSKLLQSNQFGATALIGKQITTGGNQISVSAGESSTIRYRLSADAARVAVNIHNSQGELVRTLEFGNQKSGDQVVQWDGKNSVGKSLPGGIYNFEINAFDGLGKKVAATGQVQGIVNGISLEGSEPILEIGTLKVPLSAVATVR
jgi:flagellar basal-body rod modification protein FlgD